MDLNQKVKAYNIYSGDRIADSLRALAIVFIIFLWPEKLNVDNVSISLNYLIFPIIVLLFKEYLQDIVLFGILSLLLYLLLIIQVFSGIYFNTIFKSIIYIPIFSFLIVFCYNFIEKIFKNNNEIKIIKFLKLFLSLQLLLMIGQLFLWRLGYKVMWHIAPPDYIHDGLPRPCGFFFEPSNLGFSLSPFIYILFIDFNKFVKWFGYSSIFIITTIFFLSFSTTFFAALALSFIYKGISLTNKLNNKNIFKKFAIFLIGIISIFFIVQSIRPIKIRLNQVIFRIEGKEKISRNINMSSAVFLKGFEMAKKALESYPIGVGIDNLQFLNKFTRIAKLGNATGGNYFTNNRDSGGSVLWKIIGEFGYFGLFVVFGAFLFTIYRVLENIKSEPDILIDAFMFAFIVSFLRSPGYTDGINIISLSILFWFFLKNIQKYVLIKT